MGVKALFFNWVNRREPAEVIQALRDVSLEANGGELVGIVGKNGSGKSTLLQVAAGLIEPTRGTVTARGEISPVLALGTGFDPELTGRENAALYSSLLGVGPREARARLPEIFDYAGLREFADVHVKKYSSGMFMRLAFACAVFFRKEILLVDEALSVGDQNFKKKCIDTICRMRGEGAAVLFVTHDLQTVNEVCDRAVWLEDGAVALRGNPADVTAAYLRFLESATNEIRGGGTEGETGS